MKSFLKSTPLLSLLTFLVFSHQAMGQFNSEQFEANAEKVLQFYESVKRSAIQQKPIGQAKIDEATASVDQISKQISQFFDNADDLEATAVWVSISDHLLFDTGRIYMSDSDPRGKALNQIYEKIDAVFSRGNEIYLRGMEKLLLELETTVWPILEKTSRVSNKSGVKIVADFYATSRNTNVAISPPSMVATYAALASITKGKTKEELQKLLSLEGDEETNFGVLSTYLVGKVFLNKSKYPYTYTDQGVWLIKSSRETLDNDCMLEKNFADAYKILPVNTDFTERQLRQINEGIVSRFYNNFLVHHSAFFPNFNFFHKNSVQELMGEPKVVYNVFKANRDTSMIVRPIAGVMDTFPDREIEEGDEPFEGETLPFSFDNRKRNIDFFKIEVKEHQTLTVNGQSGYRFQLGVADLTVVKCNNGVALKQLAKTITNDGLQIQLGRKVSQPVMLHIPEVDFDTEFDFQKYAQTKGFSTPFTRGKAEYTLGSDRVLPGVYCSQAKIECTFMLDCYGIVSWQQISPDAVLRALPVGRDQRLPDNIIINSPYLLLLTERKLGTVLGMAFIANPEKSEARRKHDNKEGNVYMGTIPVTQQPTSRPTPAQRWPTEAENQTAMKASVALLDSTPHYVAPGVKFIAVDYDDSHNTVQYTYILEQITKDSPKLKNISQLKAALIEDFKNHDDIKVLSEQKSI